MRMIRSALILALACLLGACFGFDVTRGSGNITTEPRKVSGFTDVEVDGSAKLIMEQGDMETLSITADDNLMQYLTSDVQGSKLMLGTKSGASIQPTAPITYKLTVKNLNSIGASGSVVVDAKGIHTNSLTVAISGAGDFTISGEADSQKIAISGSATYKAESFKTKDASISISGSGKAVMAASERLDVQVSGSGDVQYIGATKVSQSISGSGSVKAWAP